MAVDTPLAERTRSQSGTRVPYPAYKNSGVPWLGSVPAHWEVKPLKFVANVHTGLAKGRALASSETMEVPYLRVANVQDGYLDLSDVATIPATLQEARQYALQTGDVLMNEGGDFDKLGRGAVWEGQIDPCLHQNHVFAVRCGSMLEPAWLSLITSTPYAKHYFILNSKQSTNLASISSTNLKELSLLVPPAQERIAIRRYLERHTAKLDTLVAKKERLIALLEEKRAATISQAVTRGLDPTAPIKDSGVPWLGQVPAHWHVRRLKHLTSYVTSGSRGWAQHYSDTGALFLRITNLSRVSIDLNLEDRQHVSPPAGSEGVRTQVASGDVLISITAYIGSIAVVPEQIEEAYVNQHLALIRPCQEEVGSRWLAYALLSIPGQQQFRMLLNGGTKDGLGLEDVRNLLVPLPPCGEQNAIVTRLDHEAAKIDALITKVHTHIDRLREYRAALISAAVTGQIDVREAAD